MFNVGGYIGIEKEQVESNPCYENHLETKFKVIKKTLCTTEDINMYDVEEINLAGEAVGFEHVLYEWEIHEYDDGLRIGELKEVITIKKEELTALVDELTAELKDEMAREMETIGIKKGDRVTVTLDHRVTECYVGEIEAHGEVMVNWYSPVPHILSLMAVKKDGTVSMKRSDKIPRLSIRTIKRAKFSKVVS